MSVGERLAKLTDRFYDRMRHRDAFAAASGEATAGGFGALRGHKYCLLVSFRRSGEPIPTPVWFGLDAEGKLYVRTETGAAKVRRIRANPRVRVAPATVRGKPLGPLAEATARVLPAGEEARAEAALRANYGLGRRLYEGIATGPLGVPTVYLELTPLSEGARDPGEAASGAEAPAPGRQASAPATTAGEPAPADPGGATPR
jgi:PPOX class probable F420-dependent enzyme